jgi:glutathione S-transferase
LSNEIGFKSYFVDNHFNIADISAFTFLEYVDIRFKKFDWRKSFPNLNNYCKFHKIRESFALSKPETQIIESITY